MQTVNFQCGHCGQLMAVGRENLGQQVRCPHCQQVVLAPSSDGPGPEPSPFGGASDEDIFLQKGETDDVLFGQGDGPRLELPRHPGLPAEFGSNGLSEPDMDPVQAPRLEPAAEPAPQVNEPAAQAGWSPEASSPDTEPAFVAPRQARQHKESFVSPMFLLLVFLPTLLWAIGATAIGFWLYTKAAEQQNQPNSPFDKMIDDGDDAGVKKSKARVSAKQQTTRQFATSPLPDYLKVELGKEESITVGDLQVTPLRVYRSRVGIVVNNSKAEKCPNESLVLELKLKNLSDEYAFAPLDNYFDRMDKGVDPVPLTLLQAGERTLFGGAHEWVPILPTTAAKWRPRQWPQGRKNTDPTGLRPGEETVSFVCTNGWDEKTATYLFGNGGNQKAYRGPLLWRVQVRRGPHEYKGRMLSATTVIGVEFTEKDYLR